MNRAYSLLTVKAADEDQRVIEGIATTPTPDRMGDIVEPKGAEFKLPLPLLRGHDSDEPIGHVTHAKVTDAGIEIRAKLVKIDEPGALKERLDKAWQEIKVGLVGGLSIGFKAIESTRIEGTYSYRFVKWLWLELSAVTIPANGDCTIASIKSLDTAARAASGRNAAPVVRINPAAPGDRNIRPPTGQTRKATTMKTIAEQIAAFDATRATKAARMEAIMTEAAEKGETLDQAQTEEYDALAAEVKTIDAHLTRLRDLEAAKAKSAKHIGAVVDTKTGSDARDPAAPARAVILQKDLPQGIRFVRMVGALAACKGNRFEAAEFAKRWRDTTPEIEAILRTPMDVIEKAAVNPGTTTDSTWAEPLVQYQQMASEFIAYLRPMSIIGRIPGLRQVPFKIKVPRQTGGASVNWIGETKVKPLTSLAFDSVTFDHFKIAGIVPLSEELVRFSNPSAETLVRNDLASAIVQFMDNDFVDPTKALQAGVSPASITNGVSAVTPTGTTAAAFRADVKTMMANFMTANIPTTGGVWIMHASQALSLALMQNALGQPEFPGMTPEGGTLLGYPVIVSTNIPATGGSPADGYPLIFAIAPEIMLADDGGVNIDVSREASLQMESTPDSPLTASTTLVSLWQHNLIAIKAERFINWLKRRSAAVQYIQLAKYAE